MINRKEVIPFLIIIILASFTFFYKVQRDFDAEVTNRANPVVLTSKAHDTKTSALKVFEDFLNNNSYIKSWIEIKTIFISYKADTFSLPLWHFLTYILYRISHSLPFAIKFLCSSIGFLTVIFMYFVGRAMYDERIGFISAILLSSSLYYVVHVKSGFGYYGLMPLLSTASIFFFYFAHKKRQKLYLFLSGISMGLLLFNAWPAIYLVAIVIIAFIAFQINYINLLKSLIKIRGLKAILSRSLDGRENGILFGLCDYIVMFLIAGLLFVGLSVAYDSYFYVPRGTTLQQVNNYWLIGRRGWFQSRAFLSWKACGWHMKDFAKSLFTGMRDVTNEGYLTTFITPGKTMVNYFILSFFFIGLFYFIRRRGLADRLCLIWFIVLLSGNTIFSGFTARNFLFGATLISLVAGNGFLEFLETVRKKKSLFNINPNNYLFIKKIIILCLNVLFISSIINMHWYYFNEYIKKHNYYLTRCYGQAQAADYIAKMSEPKKAQVVLDYFMTSPDEALRFNTSTNDYSIIYYWPQLFEIMKNERGLLEKWEKDILEEKEKIFYVIGAGTYYHDIPGWSLWGRVDTSTFEYSHPDIVPFIAHYANGIPAIYVYEINRLTTFYKKLDFIIKNNDKISFSANDGVLGCISIKGPVEEGNIFIDDCKIELPQYLYPSETLNISEKKAEIIFQPLFSPLTYKKDTLDIRNVDGLDGDSLELTADIGYVVYKVSSASKIKEIFIKTNPVLFNDKRKKNKIICLISFNGINYREIFELKSDGSEKWTKAYYKETAHTFHPDSLVVYIKFILSGTKGQCQIWSNVTHPMTFKAFLDGNEKLPLHYNSAQLELHSLNNEYAPLTLYLFNLDK